MAEDWEGFWKSGSVLNRIVDFARKHYFAGVPLGYLGNLKNKNVLEAGCGTSETLVVIAKKAKKVTGTDISKKALDISKKKFSKNGIRKEKYSLLIDNIQNMKFRDGTFDIVFNAGVIEHFDDDRINSRPLQEMIRVTKKGGKIVVLVPSVYSPYYLYYIFSRVPGLNRIYPWDEHRFYSYRMLSNQVKELNVNYKIRLDWKTMFLYIVAVIEK
ncbi:MAG: methyltransferase domain-containing protein [Nanoarchaeota archaeon]